MLKGKIIVPKVWILNIYIYKIAKEVCNFFREISEANSAKFNEIKAVGGRQYC